MSNHGISNIKQHEEYYLRDGNICFVVRTSCPCLLSHADVLLRNEGRSDHVPITQTLFRPGIGVFPQEIESFHEGGGRIPG